VLVEADGVFRLRLFEPGACVRIQQGLIDAAPWRPCRIQLAGSSVGVSTEIRSAEEIAPAAVGQAAVEIRRALSVAVVPLAEQLARGALTLSELSLCRYRVGGFYRVHRDVSLELPQRIFTAVLYLNDVAGGGGTDFPDLPYTAQPLAGTVLLFPSVYRHASLPIVAGEKYVAVSWLETSGPSPWLAP
jgi:hypothetical protein